MSTILLILSIAVSTNVPVVVAQTPPVWGELEPGPYGVGFRVDFEVDHTRSYGDAGGNASGRPMQMSIWYPVDGISTAGTAMTYGDYVRIQAGALDPTFDTPERRRLVETALIRGPLSPWFDDEMSDEDLERVLATPMAAVRDASAAEGPFPLVIHGGFSLAGQSVLLEYLASQGYVVASVPLLGTSPAWFGRGEDTALAYEAGADDIGFVVSHTRRLRFVESDRIAMIGMFSANGLIHQMRHMQLDALGVLDGRYPEALHKVPGFDPRAVRIPILEMPRSDPTDDRSMLDELRYADILTVQFEGVSHFDFYQFQRLALPERASEHVAYRAVARTTLAFLDAVFSGNVGALTGLAQDPELLGLPSGLALMSLSSGDPPVPTENEFLLLVRENRIAEARSAWRASDCKGRPCDLADEAPLTTTLLFLRRDEGARAALDGFELLARMYPDSDRARRLLEETREAAKRP